MKILAIDAGARTGYAWGRVGETPRYGAIRLIEREHGPFDAAIAIAGNLRVTLEAALTGGTPFDLVAREAAYAGFSKRASTGFAMGALANAIEQTCSEYGVRCMAVYPATKRKFFCGHGFAPHCKKGDRRAATKLMVIKQCQAMGLVPYDCFDDDVCDALCLWVYVESLEKQKQLIGATAQCKPQRPAKRQKKLPALPITTSS